MERAQWFMFVALRSMLSLLDLAAIMVIGIVASSGAAFLANGSDPNRSISFAGLEVPAVDASTLPPVVLLTLGFFIGKSIASILLTKSTALLVAKVEARSAKEIAKCVFGATLTQSTVHSRESTMFAIQTGSPAAFNSQLNAFSNVISETSLLLTVAVGFLAIDPLATLVSILYFASVGWIMNQFVGLRMSKAGEITAKSTISANSSISDIISVYRELKVIGKIDNYIDRLYRARTSASTSTAQLYYLSGMPRYVIEAALLIGASAFILVEIVSGDLVNSAATIGVFFSGALRVTAAIVPIQAALLTIKASQPAADRAHAFLQEIIDTPLNQNKHENLSPFPGSSPQTSVSIKNVWFRYKDRDQDVIKGISFEVLKGSQVAIIGPSGAGKSTLADLICGVVAPISGSVLLQGTLPATSTNRGLGYVPQRPGLVEGTIMDNVALGVNSEEVESDRVFRSLERANLADLIDSLPAGLATILNPTNHNLSGGQLQRLGLARALYSEPEVLVMDEATSALDAESEHKIRLTLEKLRGTVTVIVVAHRLNTIQHADNVILLNDGKISDSGSFSELRARNPDVQSMIELFRIEEEDEA
jgi:ATP-binding cassette subfamily C protein